VKKWLDSDIILKEYDNEEYQECDYGVTNIDPRRIIALSRQCDEHKLESLRKKVQAYGWNDPNPQTLDIYRLPTGDYVVASGGNHRAVLSNELGLKSIPAAVTVLLPVSEIPSHIMDRIAELDRTRRQLWLMLRDIPHDAIHTRQPYYQKLMECDEEKNTILKRCVDRLGWTPT
jgi:hypothetical protein